MRVQFGVMVIAESGQMSVVALRICFVGTRTGITTAAKQFG
jgi:hypothetical protein